MSEIERLTAALAAAETRVGELEQLWNEQRDRAMERAADLARLQSRCEELAKIINDAGHYADTGQRYPGVCVHCDALAALAASPMGDIDALIARLRWNTGPNDPLTAEAADTLAVEREGHIKATETIVEQGRHLIAMQNALAAERSRADRLAAELTEWKMIATNNLERAIRAEYNAEAERARADRLATGGDQLLPYVRHNSGMCAERCICGRDDAEAAWRALRGTE